MLCPKCGKRTGSSPELFPVCTCPKPETWQVVLFRHGHRVGVAARSARAKTRRASTSRRSGTRTAVWWRRSGVKFELGRLLATPAALDALTRNTTDSQIIGWAELRRHASGDWGDVDQADKRANDEALRTGARLLSAYHLADGTKIWIITEADRSATTILLPEDY